jgi:hypothetical protein
MCVKGVDFVCFYDFSIGLWNSSIIVVFLSFYISVKLPK